MALRRRQNNYVSLFHEQQRGEDVRPGTDGQARVTETFWRTISSSTQRWEHGGEKKERISTWKDLDKSFKEVPLDGTKARGLHQPIKVMDRIYIVTNWAWGVDYLVKRYILNIDPGELERALPKSGSSVKVSSSSSNGNNAAQLQSNNPQRASLSPITPNSPNPATGSYLDSALGNFLGFLSFGNNLSRPDFLERNPRLSQSMMMRPMEGNIFVSLTRDRLLFTVGFDWLALRRLDLRNSTHPFKRLSRFTNFLGSKDSDDKDATCIVCRNTGISCIIKLDKAISEGVSDRFDSWNSKETPKHRRTVIFFNNTLPNTDFMSFSDYFSPETKMWDAGMPSGPTVNPNLRSPGPLSQVEYETDNLNSAYHFLQQFMAAMFSQVVHEWQKVVNAASEHIAVTELGAPEKKTMDLQELIRQTTMDASDWVQLRALLNAQSIMMKNTLDNIENFAQAAGIKSDRDESPIALCIQDLQAVQAQFIEAVQTRGQNLSGLVYNIIGMRIAENALSDGRSMKRIGWITFIFLPLVAVSGFFGMNVDLFSKDPSWHYYLYSAVPVLVICMVTAGILRVLPNPKEWRPRFRQWRAKRKTQIDGWQGKWQENEDKLPK